MSQRDIRFRRVSGRQLDILWEYLNSHRDIALAYNRSLRAKEYAARKWQEVAQLLNSQGEGAHKDWKSWSKYWVDFKAKLKKRAIAVRSAQSSTGGGPPTEMPLTETELKFLQIVGTDFGQGLPGIRVEPFPEASVSTHSPSVDYGDSPSSVSILVPLRMDNESQEHEIEEDQPLTATLPPSTPIPVPPTSPLVPAAAAEVEPATPRTPRRQRRRTREPIMTREAARRALVQSSQIRAEATVKSSNALEAIAQGIGEIGQRISEVQTTLQNIERIIQGAFPRAVE